MIIYLIRHGKTDANIKHLYCGSTDLPLSEAGRMELQEKKHAAEYLNATGFRFLTSGMKRCNETLQILFGNVEFEVAPGFKEIDFGVFEMHSYEELKDDPDYQEWISGDNQANCPPGGESGNQMTARVLEAFHKVVGEQQNSDTNAVIVTHGGVIAAIMAELFADEEKNMYQWQPKPGNGYRLELADGKWNWQS